MAKRIVVTGLGIVSALGIGKDAHLCALKEGKSGVGKVKYLATVNSEQFLTDASGNVATIENAFVKVYQGLGYSYKPKFNFPTVESFGDLLENTNKKTGGFHVTKGTTEYMLISE